MPYGLASMLLLGEGSEATESYNKYDKIRLHSIRSLQFDQNVRPLSFRPEKFDLFTATPTGNSQLTNFQTIELELLKQHRKRIATLIYCRRIGTTCIEFELRQTCILVINVRKTLAFQETSGGILSTKTTATSFCSNGIGSFSNHKSQLS